MDDLSDVLVGFSEPNDLVLVLVLVGCVSTGRTSDHEQS